MWTFQRRERQRVCNISVFTKVREVNVANPPRERERQNEAQCR